MEKISRCSTWVAALWDIIHKYLKRRGSNTSIASLPNELIIDILSRVPAQSVLSCKVVCSSWRCLTNTRQFTQRHLSRAAPVILGLIIGNSRRDDIWFFINDFIPNKPRFNKLKVNESDLGRHLYGRRRYYDSCNGLLILGVGIDRYVICNPMTQEHIAFELRSDDNICGFYFHGLEKEYKLLIYQNNDKPNKYSVYGLSTLIRRITLGISNDDMSVRYLGTAACGALFWLTAEKITYHGGITVDTRNIVMFNLDTENFVVKPQPTDAYKIEGVINISLREIEEKLGCCDFYAKSIEVWILEEIETWKWVKRYVVDLNGHINKGVDQHNRDARTRLVGIQNGNMLLFRSYVGLLWCNLRRNKVINIEPDLGNDICLRNSYESSSVYGMQYLSSLVSLRKSNILSPRVFD